MEEKNKVDRETCHKKNHKGASEAVSLARQRTWPGEIAENPILTTFFATSSGYLFRS